MQSVSGLASVRVSERTVVPEPVGAEVETATEKVSVPLGKSIRIRCHSMNVCPFH